MPTIGNHFVLHAIAPRARPLHRTVTSRERYATCVQYQGDSGLRRLAPRWRHPQSALCARWPQDSRNFSISRAITYSYQHDQRACRATASGPRCAQGRPGPPIPRQAFEIVACCTLLHQRSTADQPSTVGLYRSTTSYRDPRSAVSWPA